MLWRDRGKGLFALLTAYKSSQCEVFCSHCHHGLDDPKMDETQGKKQLAEFSVYNIKPVFYASTAQVHMYS